MIRVFDPGVSCFSKNGFSSSGLSSFSCTPITSDHSSSLPFVLSFPTEATKGRQGRWYSFLASCLVAACEDPLFFLAFQFAFLYRKGDLQFTRV